MYGVLIWIAFCSSVCDKNSHQKLIHISVNIGARNTKPGHKILDFFTNHVYQVSEKHMEFQHCQVRLTSTSSCFIASCTLLCHDIQASQILTFQINKITWHEKNCYQIQSIWVPVIVKFAYRATPHHGSQKVPVRGEQKLKPGRLLAQAWQVKGEDTGSHQNGVKTLKTSLKLPRRKEEAKFMTLVLIVNKVRVNL